jgi:hypothetical protein
VLLEVRVTSTPPAGAALFNVTVQASVAAPESDELLQEKLLSVDVDVPVPVKLTIAVPFAEELLVRVNCPVALPADVGSN